MPKARSAAGLVLCLLLLAGLAARQRSLPRRADAQSSVPIPGVDLLLAELAEQTERLRRQIPGVAPATHRIVRDVFASDTSAHPSEAPRVEPTPTPLPPDLPEVPGPALTLVGIAEDDERGPLERTAVISGADEALFLVKSGAVIEGRYRVGRVGSDAADIVDVASGAAFTLALK